MLCVFRLAETVYNCATLAAGNLLGIQPCVEEGIGSGDKCFDCICFVMKQIFPDQADTICENAK